MQSTVSSQHRECAVCNQIHLMNGLYQFIYSTQDAKINSVTARQTAIDIMLFTGLLSEYYLICSKLKGSPEKIKCRTILLANFVTEIE